MLRSDIGDQLLYEEYAPARESLLSYGHIKLRRHLSLIVETNITHDRLQQFRQKINGRKNFLPPSIIVPHKLTDLVVEALREPALDPKSSGIVGREAIQRFLISYDQTTKNQLALNVDEC